ncbi:MAG: Gfo/Idh/MocA family oxidoreductase [Balneolaceae bacterium]|nr:Gfo/Idh/MocA family oxidoreductase [Balneolaceae bacterium]MBO6547092.1 Gfo/Idh/MocA family oxidoreductase [Balneolaceae bacterium]MBO6647961.1 Gfo/Idh/MocA family oxidoreductase [Balneolaceae bacterium]
MKNNLSRKDFLRKSALALAGFPALASLEFPNIIIPKRKDKIGVALVGLGSYSNTRLAPGLQLTEHCELRGIVTGTPSKIPVWQERYQIPDANIYNYENMHQIANNDEIDVVYIVLPTGLHARYAIIGADAGKNVWCEKPMAKTVEDCQKVINAANKNKIQLTIGYRLQHEPNNQKVMGFTRNKTYGEIQEVKTGAGYNGGHREGNWRRSAELGGGALYDMGVYPINAARYATQMEPFRVRGRQWSERNEMYNEVDEFSEFEMEFANDTIAKGETAFGKSSNYLNVTATKGWYRLRPFQTYSSVRGEASNGIKLPANPNHQQARQMDNDALALKEGKAPVVPGEEGLKDIRIVQAIMESSREDGAWIEL